jgi:hypothetical protein
LRTDQDERVERRAKPNESVEQTRRASTYSLLMPLVMGVEDLL